MNKEQLKKDLTMIDYFYTENRDIERWASWEERKADVFEAYPELEIALKNKKAADKMLDRVVSDICSDIRY